MQKIQKSVVWAVLVSETGHIFCCVLPTIFSILGLLSGLGFVITLPPALDHLHAYLHAYERPMIAASAVVLLLGWGLYAYARKIDCHDTGCVHGACTPKKTYTHRILWAATILFAVNLVIYLIFHAH